MNINAALSLKEQYGPKSHAWQEQQSPHILRFGAMTARVGAFHFIRCLGHITILSTRAF